MKDALNYLFNWKKNPASVFYFAIPLFLIGFGSMGVVAYLHWKMSGTLVYGAIYLCGIALLILGLWHPVKYLLRK